MHLKNWWNKEYQTDDDIQYPNRVLIVVILMGMGILCIVGWFLVVILAPKTVFFKFLFNALMISAIGIISIADILLIFFVKKKS